MSADRPFLGVMLMLAFCVLAPLGDGIAKMLGASVAVGVLVLARFAIQALILVPLARKKLALPKGTLGLVLLRTVLHIAGIAMMITALGFLPLADTLAIAFVMPFILLVLGAAFMGETVGGYRWAACGVGFMGTLLVIQPNFAEVGAPALLPLGVAIVFALFMMVTRRLARQIDPVPLQAVSGIHATIMLSTLLIGAAAFGAPPQVPLDPDIWGLVLLMGVIGTLAHLFMTWSLRFAPSTTLAPMQYLEIPFATLFGFLLFGDLPNGLAAVGIVITIAAGLFIVLRERRLSRQSQVATAAV